MDNDTNNVAATAVEEVGGGAGGVVVDESAGKSGAAASARERFAAAIDREIRLVTELAAPSWPSAPPPNRTSAVVVSKNPRSPVATVIAIMGAVVEPMLKREIVDAAFDTAENKYRSAKQHIEHLNAAKVAALCRTRVFIPNILNPVLKRAQDARVAAKTAAVDARCIAASMISGGEEPLDAFATRLASEDAANGGGSGEVGHNVTAVAHQALASAGSIRDAIASHAIAVMILSSNENRIDALKKFAARLSSWDTIRSLEPHPDFSKNTYSDLVMSEMRPSATSTAGGSSAARGSCALRSSVAGISSSARGGGGGGGGSGGGGSGVVVADAPPLDAAGKFIERVRMTKRVTMLDRVRSAVAAAVGTPGHVAGIMTISSFAYVRDLSARDMSRLHPSTTPPGAFTCEIGFIANRIRAIDEALGDGDVGDPGIAAGGPRGDAAKLRPSCFDLTRPHTAVHAATLTPFAVGGATADSDAGCARAIVDLMTTEPYINTVNPVCLLGMMLPLLSDKTIARPAMFANVARAIIGTVASASASGALLCPRMCTTVWREVGAQARLCDLAARYAVEHRLAPANAVEDAGIAIIAKWILSPTGHGFRALGNVLDFGGDGGDQPECARPEASPSTPFGEIYDKQTGGGRSTRSEEVFADIADSVMSRRLSGLCVTTLMPADLIDMYDNGNRIGDLYADVLDFVREARIHQELLYHESRKAKQPPSAEDDNDGDAAGQRPQPAAAPAARRPPPSFTPPSSSNSGVVGIPTSLDAVRTEIAFAKAMEVMSLLESPEDFGWSMIAHTNAMLAAFDALRKNDLAGSRTRARVALRTVVAKMVGPALERVLTGETTLDTPDSVGTVLAAIAASPAVAASRYNVDAAIEIMLDRIRDTAFPEREHSRAISAFMNERPYRYTVRTLGELARAASPDAFAVWSSKWRTSCLDNLVRMVAIAANADANSGGGKEAAEAAAAERKPRRGGVGGGGGGGGKLLPDPMMTQALAEMGPRIAWLEYISTPATGSADSSARGGGPSVSFFRSNGISPLISATAAEVIESVRDSIVVVVGRMREMWKQRLAVISRMSNAISQDMEVGTFPHEVSIAVVQALGTNTMISGIMERLNMSALGEHLRPALASALKSSFLLFVPNWNDFANRSVDKLGFDNGVLDMSGAARMTFFRLPMIEDFITRSTRISLPYGGLIAEPEGHRRRRQRGRGDERPFSDEHPDVVDYHRYMRQLFDDPVLVKYVRWIMALILFRRNKRKKFPFACGDGNNSKSMWQLMMMTGYGEYAVDLPPEAIAEQKFLNAGAAAPHLLQMVGTCIAFVSEPSANHPISGAVIKRLTSDTDTLFLRALFSNGTSKCSINATPIMCCNDIPSITGDGDAMRNRVVIIPFGSKWSHAAPDDEAEQTRTRHYRIDPDFASKDIPRLARAMMWVLVHEYIATGDSELPTPPVVTEHIRDYWRREDRFVLFVKECLDRTDVATDVLTTKVAFRRFAEWSRETNQDAKQITQDAFVRKMDHASKLGARASPDGWIGFRIKTDTAAPSGGGGGGGSSSSGGGGADSAAFPF